MATSAFRAFPSFRRQNLLLEFASLKHIGLTGIYVSLTPGDPTTWNGVLFVRKGPYAPAILRFIVKFPRDYPFVAPLVIFNGDIFHPLLSPPTTSYNIERGASEGEDKLPPGALNLRHGFPLWSKKHQQNSIFFEPIDPDSEQHGNVKSPGPLPAQDPKSFEQQCKEIRVADILRYVRLCFEDQSVLDDLPLEEAANPGAWYAWRSFRGFEKESKDSAQVTPEMRDSPAGRPRQIRRPSQWNWEGVWEDRVKKGVRASLNESLLYGAGVTRDESSGISFLDASEEDIKDMRTAMMTFLAIKDDTDGDVKNDTGDAEDA